MKNSPPPCKNCAKIYCTVVVVIIYLLLQSDIKAKDCREFCPTKPWELTGETIFNYEGCVYKVFWQYRYLNCTGWDYCQFRVQSIIPLGDPTTCGLMGFSAYQITQAAMSAILFQEGYNSRCAKNLEPDSCVATFGITWSACFQYTQMGPGGPIILEECLESFECCYNVWKLCLDSSGNPLPPIQILQVGVNPVCTSYECFAICDDENDTIKEYIIDY